MTVHSVPGPGIINGLESVAKQIDSPRAILLLSEMSSSGNLCTEDYAKATVDMTHEHDDFVLGFISQRRTAGMKSNFLVFTPGVSLGAKGDAMGQQYNTPEKVVEQGSDVIIVGRGIYGASDILAETIKYKEAGYNAFKARTDKT